MSTIPSALPAINTLLQISTGSPATFKTIANVGDIAGPTIDGAVVDVTSHSTGTPWREKIVTLLNPGEITLPLFFIPSSSGSGTQFGHDGTNGLLSIFTSRSGNTGTPSSFKLVFPDVAATTYTFTAWITKFSLKEPVAGVVTADVTFTLTGEPTFV